MTQTWTLIEGDSLEMLPRLEDESIDSVVTDPPYGIDLMGKAWDSLGGPKQFEEWCRRVGAELLRVMKPGAYLVSFSAARTYHRMVSGFEDAGFDIRDQLEWLYGSGFPKSMDLSKALDRELGEQRTELIGFKDAGLASGTKGSLHFTVEDKTTEFNEAQRWMAEGSGIPIYAAASDAAKTFAGWGTGLKPAHEPVVLARKPLARKSVAANVIAYGTGALNIDASRIPTTDRLDGGRVSTKSEGWDRPWKHDDEAIAAAHERGAANVAKAEELGRWPTNVLLDEEAAAMLDEQAPETGGVGRASGRSRSGAEGSDSVARGHYSGTDAPAPFYGGDKGGASRFFYVAKPSKAERSEGMPKGKNVHPTVKPVTLMRYLCRLITPPGGVILDPFNGSGTTGLGAMKEGFSYVGVEREQEYAEISRARLAYAAGRCGAIEQPYVDPVDLALAELRSLYGSEGAFGIEFRRALARAPQKARDEVTRGLRQAGVNL